MATPTPDTNTRPAELASGPSATIAVQHLLGPEDSFRFSMAETPTRVTLTPNGTITITWQENDPPAQLLFYLAGSGSGYFDGIVVGWRGDEVPTTAARRLNYTLEALAGEGPKEYPRSLIVKLEPSLDTYSYTLHVAYPTGESDRTDPKIYNQGDGGPPSTGR